LKQVIGALLDVLDERISVRWLTTERFEDHHLQNTGKEITRDVVAIFHKALSDQA
jgi:hypothetical protein